MDTTENAEQPLYQGLLRFSMLPVCSEGACAGRFFCPPNRHRVLSPLVLLLSLVEFTDHPGGQIPFYFDGIRFHQLMYPKQTDSDTTYTGFFEQPLTGVRLPINPDQDVINYHFAMERADGTFDRPLTNTSNVTTATKPVNTAAVFRVDGLIFANTSQNQPKGSTTSGNGTQFLQTRQASILISYAMNGAANLTQYRWVYLVGMLRRWRSRSRKLPILPKNPPKQTWRKLLFMRRRYKARKKLRH